MKTIQSAVGSWLCHTHLIIHWQTFWTRNKNFFLKRQCLYELICIPNKSGQSWQFRPVFEMLKLLKFVFDLRPCRVGTQLSTDGCSCLWFWGFSGVSSLCCYEVLPVVSSLSCLSVDPLFWKCSHEQGLISSWVILKVFLFLRVKFKLMQHTCTRPDNHQLFMISQHATSNLLWFINVPSSNLLPLTPRWILNEICMSVAWQQDVKEEAGGRGGVVIVRSPDLI